MDLVTTIFQSATGLLIVRLDLAADITLSAESIFRSLRVLYKTDLRLFGIEQNGVVAAAMGLGFTGFTAGKNPQLRAYDKAAQLRSAGETYDGPVPLTRVEWQFRGNHCPVRQLELLEQLRDHKPFHSLQFLEIPAAYDFQNDLRPSLRRFTINKLTEDYGMTAATRILSSFTTNFNRDFLSQALPVDGISAALDSSFQAGLERFFQNQESALCPVDVNGNLITKREEK